MHTSIRVSRARTAASLLILALALALVPDASTQAQEAPSFGPEDSSACFITSPPEGTGPSSQGFNTRLHEGLDTIWSSKFGAKRGPGQVQPRGTVRAIMLFVDFPDAQASDVAGAFSDTQAYYDYLVPGAIDYFRESSYGRVELDVDARHEWYRMDHPDQWYEMGWLNPPEVASRYIQEAVSHADDDINFKQYDLIYVVPPRNASAIGSSPEWNDYEGRVSADGKTFYNGVTFGQDMWFWGHDGNGVPTGKLTVHETMHDFGLPDLYPPSGSGSFPTVGGWGLMNDIRAHSPDIFAWEKWKLGWVRDNQIDCVTRQGSTVHDLTALEVSGGTKAVVIRTGEYTALVAESRRAVGLDAQSCDPGVLIYHIDASTPNGDGPVLVRDARPGSGNQSRPGLPTCRELDRGTLGFDPGDVSTYTEGDITIELLEAGELHDVIRVTRGSSQVGARFDALATEIDDLSAEGGITVGLATKIRSALEKAELWLEMGKQGPALSQLDRAVRLLLWQADVIETSNKPNQGDADALRALAALIQSLRDDLG